MADDAAGPFEQRRRALFALAYKMLGSVAEAEDIVQEAYLRWHGADRAAIDDPRAYLTTVVVRLCLDQLKSARVARETYVGPWLPEPLVEAESTTGEDAVLLADDLSMALLLTLERLSPLERAAFLLHDAFELDFDSVAKVLGRSNLACRRLASRARANVRASPRRFTVSEQDRDALAEAFLKASRSGDVGALQRLLAEDVVLVTDGGGKKPAALNPLRGSDRVARFFAGLTAKFGYGPVKAEVVRINGLPGFVTMETGDVLQTTALEIDGDRIAAIYIMRNPDKLTHVAGVRGPTRQG